MEYPYERVAMRGEEMPDGLPLPDQLNFLGLRLIYDSARRGLIDRDTGREEKWKLSYQKYLWEQKLRGEEKLSLRCAEFLKGVERAANRYALERSAENAERLWLVVSGLMKEGKEENDGSTEGQDAGAGL